MMNDGVKILLARMETHPEEFIDGAQYGANKWSRLMQEYRPFLDKEDLEVFDAAHKATVFEYMKERFTQLVMEELLDPKSEQLELGLNPYLVRSTLSATPIPAISSITLEQTEHINAHAKALLELDKQKKPTIKVRKPTKFGKLFNYT